MKHSLILGFVGSAVLLAGCNDDKLPGSWTSGTGGIRATVGVDSSVASGSRAANGAMEISKDDLGVRLVPVDGSKTLTWPSLAAFNADPDNEDKKFAVGDYSFEVYYGEPSDEGFEKPYYFGRAGITVRENKTTDVAVTASLANSMVSIAYTDAFKDYMAAYSVTASSSAGSTDVVFEADEERAAYLTPGQITITADITKPNGKSATLQAATFNAEPRTHYTVTLDINGGEAGDGILSVSFDWETATETIEIDLSDDIFAEKAPEVNLTGFASGDVIEHVEGSAAEKPLKLDIIARGGLAKVMMTTDSKALALKGWPAEIDLLAADATVQNTLTQLGLKVLGLWRNPDKMAVIELTDLLSHLEITPGGETATTLTFVVTDRYSKTSDPVSLTINLKKLALDIIDHGKMVYGDEELSFNVNYNGTNAASNLTFQMKNERGRWDNLTIASIEETAEDTYAVSVKLPKAAENDATFRVVCGDLETEEVTVPITEPNVQLAHSANDAYATHATVTATGEADSAMSFEISTDGGNNYTSYRNVASAAARAGDLSFALTGLTPGKEYLVRVNDADHRSRPVTVVTEAATQLPDAGMDTWTSEKKGDLQYLWKVGNGSTWATMNELTTSQSGSGTGSAFSLGGTSYRATSGTIPANGRSTQSTANGGAIGTTKHSDGHTEGNATLHNNMQNSGTNAALVRTVGWGSGNAAPATNNGFGTCKNMTPGQLYLGKYEGGAVYGIDFLSRPTALKFYYHYDVVSAGNGDYGTAEINIYDKEGNEIASNSVNLTEKSSYELVTLELEYTSPEKAAKLSIVFTSSANEAALNEDTNFWRHPGRNNTSGGEFVGSELYIDDIELVY